MKRNRNAPVRPTRPFPSVSPALRLSISSSLHLFVTLLFLVVLPASALAQTTKPAVVTAAEWGSKPQPIPEARKHTPKFVTIHHAGVPWKGDRSPVDFVRGMQSWGQREKGWPDLPYHFLIAPDGTIYEGRPLEYEPESNTNYPLAGNIGVEMMGDFTTQRPTVAQLQSCARVTAWLCEAFDIPPVNIRGHNDAAPRQTTCPGKDLDRYLRDGQFVRWVRQLLAGKEVTIAPGPPLPGGPTEEVPTTRPATP